MPILKTLNQSSKFIGIHNDLAQNEELTYEAKGMLLELLSRPEDWDIYKTQLCRKHTQKTKINRIFKELKIQGYIKLFQIRSEDNSQIVDRMWIASDKPLSDAEWLLHKEGLTDRKPYIKKGSSYKEILNTKTDKYKDICKEEEKGKPPKTSSEIPPYKTLSKELAPKGESILKEVFAKTFYGDENQEFSDFEIKKLNTGETKLNHFMEKNPRVCLFQDVNDRTRTYCELLMEYLVEQKYDKYKPGLLAKQETWSGFQQFCFREGLI